MLVYWRILHQYVHHREFVKALQQPLFIRASDRVRLFYLSAKTTDVAIHRLSERIRRSGSRVDRIPPVIYSMRVGDVSPSFVVILAVSCHEGVRDEGEIRVKARERDSDQRTLYGTVV